MFLCWFPKLQMAGDLKHFISEQNRSTLRLQLNIDEIAKKYANRGEEELDSVLDITTGRVVQDKSKKFAALKRFGSSKLATTKRQDDKLRERQTEQKHEIKYSNHIELNSSGNTNLSVQSFLTHREDEQDSDEDVPVPESVLECVASFLEDPMDREPSDAETLSSHSTDSEADTAQDGASTWCTEEELTVSSQTGSISEVDDVHGGTVNYNELDGSNYIFSESVEYNHSDELTRSNDACKKRIQFIGEHERQTNNTSPSLSERPLIHDSGREFAQNYHVHGRYGTHIPQNVEEINLRPEHSVENNGYSDKIEKMLKTKLGSKPDLIKVSKTDKNTNSRNILDYNEGYRKEVRLKPKHLYEQRKPSKEITVNVDKVIMKNENSQTENLMRKAENNRAESRTRRSGSEGNRQKFGEGKDKQHCARPLGSAPSKETGKQRHENKPEMLKQRKPQDSFVQYKNNMGRLEWKEKCSDTNYKRSPRISSAPVTHFRPAVIQCVGTAMKLSPERHTVSHGSLSRKSAQDTPPAVTKDEMHTREEIKNNTNTTKVKFMEPRTTDNHDERDLVSPPRFKANTVNSSLISPIQEKYKVKHRESEILTVENVDLLNQSFNDSFVNVSQNKSGLNTSQLQNNKQKVTEWLHNLQRTEDSFQELFPTESDHNSFGMLQELKEKHESQSPSKNVQHKGLTRLGRNLFDESISKPPSKRFKAASASRSNYQDRCTSAKEVGRLSAGFIAKVSQPSINDRFRRMSKKEMKAFLECDETGMSSLISVKPKARGKNVEDNYRFTGWPETDLETSSSDIALVDTNAQLGKDHMSRNKAVEQPGNQIIDKQSIEKLTNISPKLPKRQIIVRKTPYSAGSRNDKSVSSSPSGRHQQYPIKQVTGYDMDHLNESHIHQIPTGVEMANAVETLLSPVAKHRGQFEKRICRSYSGNKVIYTLHEECGQNNFREMCHGHVKESHSNRHNDSVDERETIYTEGKHAKNESINNASLYQCHIQHKQDIRNELNRQNGKFVDTASLNEYFEEGGRECCGCNDIQDRHADLYDSFESSDRSPKAVYNSGENTPVSHRKAKLHGGYSDIGSPKGTSNAKASPYLSKERTRHQENRIQQDSPCTSMAKLKINTPKSAGRSGSLDRSPLINSENIKYSPALQSKKLVQSGLNNKLLKERDLGQHYECHLVRRSLNNVASGSPNIVFARRASAVNNETFTIEPSENEKENVLENSFKSNNQQSKSKKSLFTVTGKNRTENDNMDKVRVEKIPVQTRSESEMCFKLPVSPPVQRQLKSAVERPKIDAKYILHGKSVQPDMSVQNKVDRLSHANLVPQRFKVSEIKKTDSISQQRAPEREFKQTWRRHEKPQCMNQYDYAQSTPVRPGFKLNLNETFSTICATEDTEMEQEEEVMLIDN